MRSRGALLLIVLATMASSLLANAAGQDDITKALGPTAKRLPNGLWRVTLDDGRTLTTHGPDYAPNHGSDIDFLDPERPPVCASDYYQHVLYGRPNGALNRYNDVKANIQAAMRRINAVLNEESMETGNRTADYKVKCDGNGAIDVGSFTSAGNDFSSIANSAAGAGYDEPNVDYTIFYDAGGGNICGVGSFNQDERLVESNFSNSGGDYAVAYNDCWDNETPMHENGHNQGAVQPTAPYTTGSGRHCNDENDVMCYAPDGGDKNQTIIERCTDRIHFDCGNDTYFDSQPEQGEYLSDHWNIGSPLNRFIQFGPPLTGAPRAAMGIACSGLTCAFTDASTDDGTIAGWRWYFGDYASSTLQNPTHAFYQAGIYEVTLTVRDNDGGTSTWVQRLYVPNNGDPDLTTPNLENNAPRPARSETPGRWQYFKIFVPAGRPSLTVTMDGPPCTAVVVCTTDLDLYVQPGIRPRTDGYVCRPFTGTDDEQCVISAPASGIWYVGIYAAQAPPAIPNVSLNLYSVNYTVTASY